MTTEVHTTRGAAMLLLALGESEAASVLKHLDARVVQKLGSAMAELKSASREEVATVVGGFVDTFEGQADIRYGSDEYLRKVLSDALGADRANGVLDRILSTNRKSKGLEVLKWMEPSAVAELVRNEHPQVLSIIVSWLDPDQAAKVLQALPESTQADVLLRVATLENVQPAALSRLDEIIEKQIAARRGAGAAAGMGGAKTAAGILNFMPANLIEELRKADEQLTDKLQELMFVFEDLGKVDDRGMQTLLREVDSARLVVALKGASPALVAHFFKNMSQRAGEMLKDDMESRGPVKLSEVEAAQKEIIVAARKLADAGTLVLGNAGGEAYL